jgi:mRNA-degrading endonuclease RelE of RelBE toxin-antitoxin system
MQVDPFGGDIARLENQPASWRRRVGNYRIFFDVHPDQMVVDILRIRRRTSTTY